ncbi:MAG: LysR family transcriptional regulator [Lachnotalea sp.]
MNLNHLYYFVTLAHLEHYTKAANELSITQPSLSHAITLLENELETYLFEKQGRNVVLTKYGRVFLKYVEESLGILESGIKKTKMLTSVTSGFIDLAFIYTLGTHYVPQIVARFLRQNQEKDIKFSFTSAATTDIIKGLKEEKFDIAFCSKIENEKEIEFIPIGEQELVVIVPTDHPLAVLTFIDLKETINYPQIYFSKTSGLRPVIDDLYRQIDETPNILYEVEEDGAVAGLVAENFGIAVLPNISILQSLNVKILEITNPRYTRNIYMARVKNKYLTPVVQQFAKFVQEQTEISI